MKYNNFIFWWKADSDRWGSNFKKYWRFRKAYNEGVIDFYMSTILIIGGLTMTVGFLKGYRKGGKETHRE